MRFPRFAFHYILKPKEYALMESRFKTFAVKRVTEAGLDGQGPVI